LTKNQNLRIDLWNGEYFEKIPLFTIIPFEKAKRLMIACDYDLEVFSKYIYVHEGRQIKVINVEQTATGAD